MEKEFKKESKEIQNGDVKAVDKNLTLNITRFDDAFCGIAYIGSRRYVVPKALPKEKIEASSAEVFNNIHYAKLEKILEPSADRIKSPCKYYNICGGCNLLHMNYEAGVNAKISYLNKKLAPFTTEISECIKIEQFESRNKVHIAFSGNGKNIDVGFFNEETHRVMNIPVCLMHGKWYSELVKILKEWIISEDVSIYNPRTRTGTLRFAVARRLNNTLQLTFVATVQKLPGLKTLFATLTEAFGDISLWMNINNEKTNEVFAGKFVHIMGNQKIYGEMLGIKYSLSPNSFFQVNEKIAERIYEKVIKIIKETGVEYAVDAFSGIGIVSMLLAKAGIKVIAVEIVKDATVDAKALAKENGVESGVQIVCGDCKDVLPDLKLPKNTAFFVDPPRKGLGIEVISPILKFSPQTILYLSCNPDTLASDLDIFTKNNYSVTSVQPYDMFPNTRHLETLVGLTKKS